MQDLSKKKLSDMKEQFKTDMNEESEDCDIGAQLIEYYKEQIEVVDETVEYIELLEREKEDYR